MAGVTEAAQAWGERVERATATWGRAVTSDWPALLDERATLRGLVPRGRISHGGSTRLLPSADGWVAVSMARSSDVELVPAWRGVLGLPPLATTEWEQVADLVRSTRRAELAVTAELLGLPVGVLGERHSDPQGGATVEVVGSAAMVSGSRPVRVLDLSSLWAGPLCASLLGLAGAEVTKVESVGRPDGARCGDPQLYERLNASKRIEAIDLRTPDGRRRLADWCAAVDVVVESSRPRALEQLGVVAADLMAAPDGPRVWVSITGHGRASNRVAFGDDAAVAGGLVDSDAVGPVFGGDALADPLSGLAAAATAAEVLARGERALVDVAMAGVAAGAAAGVAATAGSTR